MTKQEYIAEAKKYVPGILLPSISMSCISKAKEIINSRRRILLDDSYASIRKAYIKYKYHVTYEVAPQQLAQNAWLSHAKESKEEIDRRPYGASYLFRKISNLLYGNYFSCNERRGYGKRR